LKLSREKPVRKFAFSKIKCNLYHYSKGVFYFFYFPRLYQVNTKNLYACSSLDFAFDASFLFRWASMVIISFTAKVLFNLTFSRLAKLCNFYLPPWQNALSMSTAHVMVPHAVFGFTIVMGAAGQGDPAFSQNVRRWLMFVMVDTMLITALSVRVFFSRIFKDSDGGLFGPFSLVFNTEAQHHPSTTTHPSAKGGKYVSGSAKVL
jgi:hypothetical protein